MNQFSLALVLIAMPLFAVVPFSESTAIQGGALAILGWTVWYLLARALPGERKLFLEAQEKTRADFREALVTLADSFDRLRREVEEQGE